MSNDAAARIRKDVDIGYTLPGVLGGKRTGKVPEGPNLALAGFSSIRNDAEEPLYGRSDG